MSNTTDAATGRRLKLMVGGLVLILAAGFLIARLSRSHHDSTLSDQALKDAASPPPIEAITAQTGKSALPLTLPGQTASWFESTIYARVNGYVGSWKADIGDHVTKGQVLATIETPELDADLLAAKAKLRAGEAEISRRQAEADFADTTYARWQGSPKGVVSEQEREDKKAQYASAKANLEAARAQMAVDQAAVDRLNSFQQFKQVVAPYDGTITERRIDIGDLSTQSTPFFRISKADPLRVFVDVPQSAAGDLMKPGIPVDIDIGGRHVAGRTARTSGAIDTRARTFRAEIDLPNPDLALLPGMYVQAAFQLGDRDAVQVPASAMLFRPDGPHVAIVDDRQKVHFAPVSIARDEGSVIELGSGLRPGDKVVLNISNQVTEGDAVHVTTLDGKPLP